VWCSIFRKYQIATSAWAFVAGSDIVNAAGAFVGLGVEVNIRSCQCVRFMMLDALPKLVHQNILICAECWCSYFCPSRREWCESTKPLVYFRWPKLYVVRCALF